MLCNRSTRHPSQQKYESEDRKESSGKYSVETEYNEEYDYGMAHNVDYEDEPRLTSHFGASHYNSDEHDTEEESFYSTTDFMYSFPKCK